MAQVDTYLLYHTPGYRWMKAHPHLFEEIDNMDGLQSIRIAYKCFRYSYLNQVVSGNWATEGAKQQRRNRWVEAIKREARIIFNKTNVSYNKVFHLLFNRMLEEINR